jgi:hypothetical protein
MNLIRWSYKWDQEGSHEAGGGRRDSSSQIHRRLRRWPSYHSFPLLATTPLSLSLFFFWKEISSPFIESHKSSGYNAMKEQAWHARMFAQESTKETILIPSTTLDFHNVCHTSFTRLEILQTDRPAWNLSYTAPRRSSPGQVLIAMASISAQTSHQTELH